MRILHVIPSYIPAYRYGGPVKGTHELCRALARRGLEISVFTTDADYEGKLNVVANKEENIDGVNVTYYPARFARAYYYSGELRKALRDRISEFDIVHIHSVFLYPTYISAYWCRKKNIPYIINPFGALDPAMIALKNAVIKKAYLKIIEKRNIEKAVAVHLASSYEKKQFLSLGFDAPVVVIPRGLDFGDYAPPRPKDDFIKRHPQLKGKKLILFLGRIHFKKGIDLLAGAFAKVIRRREDAYLIIAGPGEEGYIDKLKRLLKKLKLTNRVLLAGMLLNREKLAVFYASDIFVLPSYGENFGITVLEAMACKLPVVITNRVGLYPAVEEGEAGIITDCDSEEIAQAMLRLLNDSALCESMGDSGRRFVEDNFGWDGIADRMRGFYNCIAENNTANFNNMQNAHE